MSLSFVCLGSVSYSERWLFCIVDSGEILLRLCLNFHFISCFIYPVFNCFSFLHCLCISHRGYNHLILFHLYCFIYHKLV